MPGPPKLLEGYDLSVVGGGHAGLAAGLKAALLHHTAAVVDRGPKFSRSYYAPRMDNIPGFPDGISGHKLLDAQIAAVRKWDALVGYFTPARVTAVRRVEGGFETDFEWLAQRRQFRSRAVVLALGVVDRMPIVNGEIDPIFPWANLGIVDFCLFCDGHKMPGVRLAVIGASAYAVQEAIDLWHFAPASVTLLTQGEPLLGDAGSEEKSRLEAALARTGTQLRTQRLSGFDGIRQQKFHVKFDDGTTEEFDKGFSALGWYDLHQELPRSLGATFDAEGNVVTDEDCRILDAQGEPIPGVYCVGDLRNGWNQIPEAWATAERAVIHAYGYYL